MLCVSDRRRTTGRPERRKARRHRRQKRITKRPTDARTLLPRVLFCTHFPLFYVHTRAPNSTAAAAGVAGEEGPELLLQRSGRGHDAVLAHGSLHQAQRAPHRVLLGQLGQAPEPRQGRARVERPQAALPMVDARKVGSVRGCARGCGWPGREKTYCLERLKRRTSLLASTTDRSVGSSSEGGQGRRVHPSSVPSKCASSNVAATMGACAVPVEQTTRKGGRGDAGGKARRYLCVRRVWYVWGALGSGANHSTA